MKENKFKIGDLVKFKQDKDSDAGEVLSLSFGGKEWSYRLSSKEVDLEAKEIINGIKTGMEDELVLVKSK
ncbi:MAG: hypothetical protein UW18_C0015G0005 [Microgenomates group bacterium GW2011_GWF1_44_10]|nr:MAG: hypothetical protein UW18_C0015G0005 [Microgenomates group bacterium GW2011_GWF1_44_10]